jgi:hypothetical protein
MLWVNINEKISGILNNEENLSIDDENISIEDKNIEQIDDNNINDSISVTDTWEIDENSNTNTWTVIGSTGTVVENSNTDTWSEEQLDDNSNAYTLILERKSNTTTWTIVEYLDTGTWTTNKVKIWDLYKFENYLSLYNQSDDTKKLQEFLTLLWYFKWEVSGKFDIETRNALREVLMYKCHWPSSTKWVLWDKWAECIEGLEVEVK